MSTLRISDLETSRVLGSQELSTIRGGDGAPWVYGWITAFNPLAGRAQSAAVNFVQNNTIFMAEQMTNQFLQVGVNNTGNGANINVVPTTVGITQKQ
ncbi:MAG: hypothetical protein JWM30_569 [Burkholderia sp.]|jgi:hypothetical protein|nr:hypothetical protein [Burkholderia sp.]